MNALTFARALIIGTAALACQPADQPMQGTAHKLPDTLLIDEYRLGQSTRFDPLQNPISREDVVQLTGAKAVQYKADTLATTDAVHIVLMGRLYGEETIGWLMTVNPVNRRVIDKQIVYYDNAEGMTETRTKWLPRQQRAIVETGAYDEADNYRTSRVVYAVRADGTFSTIR